MKFTKMEIAHQDGAKVVIVDIPVFIEDNPRNFEISVYLDMLINEIHLMSSPSKKYSLIDYLDKMMFCNSLVKQVNQFKNQQYLVLKDSNSKKIFSRKTRNTPNPEV